jgi:hypothetical protein
MLWRLLGKSIRCGKRTLIPLEVALNMREEIDECETLDIVWQDIFEVSAVSAIDMSVCSHLVDRCARS